MSYKTASAIALGIRMRDRRVGLRMTMMALAKRADCTMAAISMIENGRLMPKLQTASRIAEALDVSVDWLLNGLDDSPVGPITDATLGEIDRIRQGSKKGEASGGNVLPFKRPSLRPVCSTCQGKGVVGDPARGFVQLCSDCDGKGVE